MAREATPVTQERVVIMLETTAALLVSFSTQSASLLYESLRKEFEDYLALEAAADPGTWQETYLKNLADLFEKERVPFDVTFQVGSEVVKAHRCILEARKFHPLTALIEREEFKEEEPILIHEPPYSNPQFLLEAVKACYGIAPATHLEISISVDAEDVIRDIHEFDPNKAAGTELHATFLPSDDQINSFVQIAGSPGTKSGENHVWKLWAHKAILGAHSEYFRSAMEWDKREEGSCHDASFVHLDSDQFSFNVIKSLVSCCYGPPRSNDCGQMILAPTENVVDLLEGLNLDVEQDEHIGFPLKLVLGASYLMMPAASLLHEAELADRLNSENIVKMLTFAEDNGAQLLQVRCYKYLCENLSSNNLIGDISKFQFSREDEEEENSVERPWKKCPCFFKRSVDKEAKTITLAEEDMVKKHPALRLTFNQLRNVLQSKCIETQESELLEIVLFWSSITRASTDTTKELVNLIRLPFVPVTSKVMKKAVDAGLVTGDMICLCRLFQEDEDYRIAVITNENDHYCPRYSTQSFSDLEVLSSLHDILDSSQFVLCRMFGVVNGRMNFGKISSINRNENGDHLVCVLPDSSYSMESYRIDFPFAEIVTAHMPVAKTSLVDKDTLEHMDLEEVETLLAAMLKREDELRLHHRIQEQFGSFGEHEQRMSMFTTSLQAHVSNEFNVDPQVGIQLIRSATTLFPETAQLAHYVKHNRAFEGPLKVGDLAPDVDLLSITGNCTTLWTELNTRIMTEPDGAEKPVAILAASFT